MVGICSVYVDKEFEQNQWDYTLLSFTIDKLWILSQDNIELPNTKTYGKGTIIKTLEELPEDHKVIIMQPKLGRYIQGEEPLHTFEHPNKNVIYVFGSDYDNFKESYIGNRKVDYKVYVPVDRDDEMYSFQSCVVTLYDRKLKLNELNG